jgi:uncharacterized protein (DUF885 family)
MPDITLDMVDACAAVLYRDLAPKKSQESPFLSLSARRAESYRSIARAGLIMASATAVMSISMDERLNRIAEALYLQIDPKASDHLPFKSRSEGSRKRYREYAQILLNRSGL